MNKLLELKELDLNPRILARLIIVNLSVSQPKVVLEIASKSLALHAGSRDRAPGVFDPNVAPMRRSKLEARFSFYM